VGGGEEHKFKKKTPKRRLAVGSKKGKIPFANGEKKGGGKSVIKSERDARRFTVGRELKTGKLPAGHKGERGGGNGFGGKGKRRGKEDSKIYG